MNIETMPINSVLLDPSNARTHSNKNLDAIKASLLKFGQQKPIVINDKGIVIAGNGTLLAAKELGWTDVKCVRSELGKVEQTAFAIADNRTTDLSDWDKDILADTLLSLKDDDWDLKDLGFEEDDMPEFLKDTGGNEGLTDPDDVPEVNENEFNVERGQIWLLGAYLECDKCKSKYDYDKEMIDKRCPKCLK